MKKIITIIGSFFYFLFLAVPFAYAGGAMMAIYADTNGFVNNDGLYLRVIRVYLHPEYPCKGSKITFSFADPQDGDYVMTGSGTATYTMQEDRTAAGCSTYAKMGSKVKGLRRVNIDLQNTNQVGGFTGQNTAFNVDFDGEYHADNSYNGYSYRTATTDPYSNVTTQAPPAIINAWILNQQTDSSGIRQVTVKWGAFDGNPGTFSILGTTDKANWETLIDGQKGPSATVAVKSNGNYFLKVHGCIDKWGTCADSNVLMVSNTGNNQNNIYTPKEKVTPTPNDNNQKTDELNQKINDLQNQLDQSRKKQSVLEQRITDLVNFIKRLFPFFK